MPRRRIPKYRCYKPKNLGLVVLDGKQHYLGPHGSPESLAAYHRLIQEWLVGPLAAAGPPEDPGSSPSVDELILAFWTRFAQTHYRRPDGTPSRELDNYRDSFRQLRRLYGATPARDFGPLALKAVRQAMIEAGLARTTINQRIGRVVRLFKWAVENELLPPAIHQALRAVRGLQKGRSPAREPAPVRPVPEDHVAAIRPWVARQVWAMVELQRLTGMRPGEVCRMRTGDLDLAGRVWVYTPPAHKTAHRDRVRQVYLGPRAQAVVRPWLRTDLAAPLFSPREAMEERREKRRRRTTPSTPSPRARTRARYPGRPPGERYTPMTYHHAIGRACHRAGVPSWHPHRLRHNAATWLRKEFGLDVARVILGHSSPATAEIYAELDRAKAIAVMEQVG